MGDRDQRLEPAADEEIIALAKSMSANPQIMRAFERCGYEGDLTDEEEASVDEAIDTFGQGPLQDRDRLHLALAPCLLRLLVAGKIDDLDSEAAHEFLKLRKVVRIGGAGAIKSVPTKANEIIEVARAMHQDEEVWAIYARIKENDTATEEEEERITRFLSSYKKKFGLFNYNIAAVSVVDSVLRAIAAGRIDEINSEEALKIVASNPHVVN